MPSPTCTIGGGSTPASVAASSTINGALANAAGVNLWFLTCVGTDDVTGIAAILATLSVNQSAKTFSFTSGAAPSAYIFQSTVGVGTGSKQGAGCDANNVVQPLYTVTFKVYVPTAGGSIVMAQNEQLEQDSVYGWIKVYNALVRKVG